MKFSCLTWNTARKSKRVTAQASFIKNIDPDIVALQEIVISSNEKFLSLLEGNYPYLISSFELAPEPAVLRGKRMYGQIIASKIPLMPLNPASFSVPWQERVLSAKLDTNPSSINFHTTHIPPGSSNGWIKIEMLEGIFEHMVRSKDSVNILCGDFNTPKAEVPGIGPITFAQRLNGAGEFILRKRIRGQNGKRWDLGERNILSGLKQHGMTDSYRKLHSYDVEDYSWEFKRKGSVLRRRFDHFIASDELEVLTAKYMHNDKGLSDHSPLIVEYGI